jgi:hypothetical protein
MSVSNHGDGPSPTPNLQHQRKLAKNLFKSARARDAEALARIRAHQPQLSDFKLAHAQLAIAREAGFDSWPKLVKAMEVAELEEFKSALERGDALAVRRVLGTSPSARRKINDPIGDFGGRPINVAAAHRAVLDVLLDFGADVNLRSDWENGPFGVLDYCDESTARHLIKRGATLTAHAAARFGWLDELRAIVDTNPTVVHEKGGDGQRPLHFAKTPEIAGFLLDRGAEIDARCVDHHSTAAQYALAERPDVCRFLIDRGATPDIFMPARLGDMVLANRLIDDDPSCLSARTRVAGYAPVHQFGIYNWSLGFFVSPHDVALKFGHREVYELLLRRSPSKVAMLDAIARGDRAAAERARTQGLTLSADDHSLLAIAIFHEQGTRAARLMLELGFDPSAGGIDGGSALHAAAWVGDVDTLDAILATKRVDVNLRDPTHKGTPLGWAVYGSVHRRAPRGNYVGVIQRLVTVGASFDPAKLIEMANGNPEVQDTIRRLTAPAAPNSGCRAAQT